MFIQMKHAALLALCLFGFSAHASEFAYGDHTVDCADESGTLVYHSIETRGDRYITINYKDYEWDSRGTNVFVTFSKQKSTPGAQGTYRTHFTAVMKVYMYEGGDRAPTLLTEGDVTCTDIRTP